MKRSRLLAKQYDSREAERQRILRLHREWMALESQIRVKYLGAHEADVNQQAQGGTGQGSR
jgi:hypothetical protein